MVCTCTRVVVMVGGVACDGRIKKGPANHWDLMVVALLNAVLAYFGLPLVHGALPHVEDLVYQGFSLSLSLIQVDVVFYGLDSRMSTRSLYSLYG